MTLFQDDNATTPTPDIYAGIERLLRDKGPQTFFQVFALLPHYVTLTPADWKMVPSRKRHRGAKWEPKWQMAVRNGARNQNPRYSNKPFPGCLVIYRGRADGYDDGRFELAPVPVGGRGFQNPPANTQKKEEKAVMATAPTLKRKALPDTVEDLLAQRLVQDKPKLRHEVEQVFFVLYSNPTFRALRGDPDPEHYVEGSEPCDDTLAAQMIREKGLKMELPLIKVATLHEIGVKLRAAERRYNAARTQRENAVEDDGPGSGAASEASPAGKRTTKAA